MASWPLVIGHKGAAAVAPENTLPSFRLALDAGVDGMECDLHATSDRVPVIIHDDTVERTTNGSGEIARLTLEQLRSLDASGGQKEFAGVRVPTLLELLELVAGRCLLVLEYKALAAVAPSAPVLRAVEAAEWCTAWSFQPDILAALREQLPELSRTLLVGTKDDWAAKLDRAQDLGCVGVSLRQEHVDDERVRSARAMGLRFFAWTANEDGDWRRLIEAGVDGIVTDDPARLRSWLGA